MTELILKNEFHGNQGNGDAGSYKRMKRKNGRKGRNKKIGEHFYGVKTNYCCGGKKINQSN